MGKNSSNIENKNDTLITAKRLPMNKIAKLFATRYKITEQQDNKKSRFLRLPVVAACSLKRNVVTFANCTYQAKEGSKKWKVRSF